MWSFIYYGVIAEIVASEYIIGEETHFKIVFGVDGNLLVIFIFRRLVKNFLSLKYECYFLEIRSFKLQEKVLLSAKPYYYDGFSSS